MDSLDWFLITTLVGRKMTPLPFIGSKGMSALVLAVYWCPFSSFQD